MKEYIHFFENSDLRDVYEHGSDYTEPYVSYTPIINRYEAQFNGAPVPIPLSVKKLGDLYQISSDNINLVDINDNIIPFMSVESNSFYLETSNLPNFMFIFPEDLNLTEESTEFTFNGITYSIELGSTNAWHVTGRNPDEGLLFDTIVKIDIVSVPSSSNDFVHYNKISPAKSIYAKIVVEYNESNDQPAVMRRKISRRNDIFEKIIVDGNEILFNNVEPTRGQDSGVYYTFSSEGIYNVEYVLKDEYAGIMPENVIPSHGIKFDEITLPKGIYKIESRAIEYTNYPGLYLNLNIPDTVNEVEDCAITCTTISSEVENFLTSINPSSICNNCK